MDTTKSNNLGTYVRTIQIPLETHTGRRLGTDHLTLDVDRGIYTILQRRSYSPLSDYITGDEAAPLEHLLGEITQVSVNDDEIIRHVGRTFSGRYFEVQGDLSSGNLREVRALDAEVDAYSKLAGNYPWERSPEQQSTNFPPFTRHLTAARNFARRGEDLRAKRHLKLADR